MNFVFDLGGVVFDEKNGATMRPLKEQVSDGTFSFLWANLLLGRFKMTDVIYGNGIKVDMTSYEFYEENLPAFPEVVDAIRKLQQNGHRIYIVSNATDAMKNYAEEFFARNGIKNVKFFFSCDMHLMKPDVEIFEEMGVSTCLKWAHWGQTIYFDDKEKNCLAAYETLNSCTTVLVKTPQDILDAVQKWL